MKVTVCELKNGPDRMEDEWEALVRHVRAEDSDVLVLPEMPFFPWIAQSDRVDADVWSASVAAHERFLPRFSELAPTAVAGTRPVVREGRRLNEAFIWEETTGYTAAHHKAYLPDDEGWWEASWYDRGKKEFAVVPTPQGRVGFLICTEIWFGAHAREYAKQGIELLICPRATGAASTDKWIAGGRTAAVVSGAWSLSSNFSPGEGDGNQWGGAGWIIEPENGQMVGLTTADRPFVTLDVDLVAAMAAKRTYPRCVSD